MLAERKPTTGANCIASADWRPERVIYELHLRGLSIRQLSIRNGLAPRSLYDALRKPWVRGEQIIARALRMRPREIWPQRFANRSSHGSLS